MFWLKLKKSLGLIRTKKFEQIVLFNKIRNSGMFDEQYYLHKYPDVKQAKLNPIHHYLTFGWQEGRNPSTHFDTNAYLANNPDVASAKVCPLVHYINYGKLELPADSQNSTISRAVYKTVKKSKLFNKKWYLKKYPDVKSSKIDAVEHYIRYGANEGRNPSKHFDTIHYLNTLIP